VSPSARPPLLRRRFGDPVWDGMLRVTGLLALLGIPAVLWLPPAVGGLIGFLLVTIWCNGPLGIFMPATYEPILMLFGRIYPPLLIAVVGVLGVLFVEYLNYHVYGQVLRHEKLRAARESQVMRRIVALFGRAPFFTIWICSWSPLPYWLVRILGAISRYPVRRYLLATLLGRFPRLWFFASLGVWWDVDAAVLAAIAFASIALAVGVYLLRRDGRAETASGSGGLGPTVG
jgi:uncharacterized membrane protein YdjX (TVP38/TMEM64 family)